MFKFLGEYLGWNLSVKERLKILTEHYIFLNYIFQSTHYHKLTNGGISIWSHTGLTGLNSIVLQLSGGYYMEGELVLSYFFNSEKLYNLAFTVAPGDIFGVQADHVIVIGASQGADSSAPQIRLAARGNGEIDPATMLLLALQSMAAFLKIDNILGVSVDEQICRSLRANPGAYLSTYDHFWEMHGGFRVANYYHLSSAISEKPIESVPRAHRQRTKRKRALKHQLFQEIFEHLEDIMLNY